MSELKHPNEINRDYIRLLQGMSRFIKEEFSVAIRMTQEDAVDQLLHYAEQSGNNVLLEMGKELREMAYGTDTAPAASSSANDTSDEEHVRYYRGAPVVSDAADDNIPVKEAEPVQPPVQEKSKPVRVYRGRVISS